MSCWNTLPKPSLQAGGGRVLLCYTIVTHLKSALLRKIHISVTENRIWPSDFKKCLDFLFFWSGFLFQRFWENKGLSSKGLRTETWWVWTIHTPEHCSYVDLTPCVETGRSVEEYFCWPSYCHLGSWHSYSNWKTPSVTVACVYTMGLWQHCVDMALEFH